MKRYIPKILCAMLGVAVLAGTVSFSSCSNSTTTGSDDYVVQIPATTAICSAPVFVAVENGYFSELGVKYEIIKSDLNQWDLMISGKGDAAFGLLPTFVQRIANGVDSMHVAMGYHQGCINVVAADASGIKTIADLKGRNVGVPGSLGSDPAVMLQRMLTAYGIHISDVNVSVYQNADLAVALSKGHVDAFVSWDPYATEVSTYQGNHLIFNQATDEMTANEYCCVLGLRKPFVEEHPDIAKSVAEAMSKASDFVASNPEEAAKISYEKGWVADPNYVFNGKLLATYKYKANYEDAKQSFIDVTKDLINLKIITLKESAEDFGNKYFKNVGNLKR